MDRCASQRMGLPLLTLLDDAIEPTPDHGNQREMERGEHQR